MLLAVSVDAPPVRTPIRAQVALDPRLRVHALELLMPPQGPLHRVALAADRAHVASLALFDDAVVLLLMQLAAAAVVSVRPFVRPQNS